MFRHERMWKELNGEDGAARLGATKVEGEDGVPGVPMQERGEWMKRDEAVLEGMMVSDEAHRSDDTSLGKRGDWNRGARAP